MSNTGNSAVDRAAAQMAGQKTFGDFVYLNKKFGRYELELQATKVKDNLKTIAEFKVIKAEKTQANEPHRVGEIVSYTEDLANPQKGGGSRFQKMLLTLRDMTEAEITTAEYQRPDGKTVIAEGDNAKSLWLQKFLNEEKQPCAFLRVICEVEPRPVEAKDGKPAAVYSKERWTVAPLTDKDLDEIEAKRAAAKLPNLSEAMK